MNTIAIIIPTYNARKEIVDSIYSIKKILPEALILIVDDSSPDGTSEIVKTTFQKDKHVKLLIRKGKGGRGSAVIDGFKEALKNKSFDYFIEMDADLCHNPKYIPEFIKKNKTADIIIASKYLPGSTIKGLTMKRKVMSKLMNFGARIILQVPITDYTNGYRCYNRKVVEFLVKQKFRSRGFVVLSEIVFRSYKKRFTFAEIPFDFKQVSQGATNLDFKEITEAILTLVRLRFEK